MNDRKREIEMILRPYNWPQFPFLPMKKRNGNDLEAGVLIAWGKHIPIVFKINLWNIKGLENAINSDAIEYENIEEMLNDGWEVD